MLMWSESDARARGEKHEGSRRERERMRDGIVRGSGG